MLKQLEEQLGLKLKPENQLMLAVLDRAVQDIKEFNKDKIIYACKDTIKTYKDAVDFLRSNRCYVYILFSGLTALIVLKYIKAFLKGVGCASDS